MKKKTISVVLLAAIFLQSCVAYQKNPVSLHGARYLGRVKITSINGDISRYKVIELQDSIYVGIKGKDVTPLDADQILNIQLQDVTKSKSQTSLIISTMIIAALALVAITLIVALFTAIGTI